MEKKNEIIQRQTKNQAPKRIPHYGEGVIIQKNETYTIITKQTHHQCPRRNKIFNKGPNIFRLPFNRSKGRIVSLTL